MNVPQVTVNIRNIAVGGAGVGEVTAQDDGERDLLGITAFVPFTALREQVKARVIERKQRFVRCELLVVEEASPNRVSPHCPYFGICGGCELQHLAYEEQLSSKLELIRGSLRVGGVPAAAIDTLQPIKRGREYRYRRRINLHIDRSGKVGFYRPGSRSVVEISVCPISTEKIEALLENAARFGRAAAGLVSSLILEEDDEGVVAIAKCQEGLNAKEEALIIAKGRELFADFRVESGLRDVGGTGRSLLNLSLGPRTGPQLKVPAGSFSQVNWHVNQQLINYVVSTAKRFRSKEVLDLYSGAGNFSLPLAFSGAIVTAVECDERLVNCGREAAQTARLDKRLSFVASSVERFLGSTRSRSFPLVVADPPRSGLGKAAEDLPPAEHLIAVFCHLPSLVRDLKTLTMLGWSVDEIQPFDMFAQTSYVETAVLLSR